jgi:hypothetical protein
MNLKNLCHEYQTPTPRDLEEAALSTALKGAPYIKSETRAPRPGTKLSNKKFLMMKPCNFLKTLDSFIHQICYGLQLLSVRFGTVVGEATGRHTPPVQRILFFDNRFVNLS